MDLLLGGGVLAGLIKVLAAAGAIMAGALGLIHLGRRKAEADNALRNAQAQADAKAARLGARETTAGMSRPQLDELHARMREAAQGGELDHALSQRFRRGGGPGGRR